MRVLQVSKFYPPVFGGIETVAWELTEGLNRAGLRTDVLCADQQVWGRHDRVGGEPGYEVWRAGSLGRVLSTSISPAMPLRLRRLAARYDVMHVHMPDPMAAAAVCIARPDCLLVVHWHSDVVRQRRALALYEPLQDWLLARANLIVATSQPYADASPPLRQWRRKIRVVPIGISDNRGEACHVRAREIRQSFRGRRIVFALGRMTYYKGIEILIEASTRLPEDCVVLIGGDGELFEDYRRTVASRGLAGKVHLLGHIADHELASYFEACDLFCMSSTVRSEAYGVAIVEAMVMGKPVVATDIEGSGVPWVNQHGRTGYNVPVRNPQALADAIRSILEDTAGSNALGAAARQRYEDEFSADLMTRRMIDAYREAMAERL